MERSLSTDLEAETQAEVRKALADLFGDRGIKVPRGQPPGGGYRLASRLADSHRA
ncbi:MAG: hypothetical protein LC118_17695 [Dehalococcoidia bacterium]|nr:hypothetical protein [Dehalococcoidia bacterium]